MFYKSSSLITYQIMFQSDEQTRRVVEYYRRSAENYDKEYDIPYFKELYDKITWRYIEPYLPEEGIVLDAGGELESGLFRSLKRV